MNRDVLFSIALEMDLPDIMRLCETSKKVNEYVCKNRNFWLIKLKKTYPKVPVEKIQDPKGLYIKLYNISTLNPKWDYWSALKQQDNDLINSLSFIHKVTYPFIIITNENEWKFYDTFVVEALSFFAGFPRDISSHTLLRMIIEDGVSIENYYDFKNYQKKLDEERKSRVIKDERIEEIARYLRSFHTSYEELSNSLTNILYNYLKEKGQIYPSGTPYEKIYVKND